MKLHARKICYIEDAFDGSAEIYHKGKVHEIGENHL